MDLEGLGIIPRYISTDSLDRTRSPCLPSSWVSRLALEIKASNYQKPKRLSSTPSALNRGGNKHNRQIACTSRNHRTGVVPANFCVSYGSPGIKSTSSSAPSQRPSRIFPSSRCRCFEGTENALLPLPPAGTLPSIDMAQLYCIGRGSCGTVWGEKQQQNEEPFSEVAYKASFHERALWRDFNLTNRVHNAFLRMQELMEDFFPGITVPRIPSATHFFKPSSPWWGAEHSPPMFLPPEIPADGGGQAVMRTQRILPLPSSTREILINSYFDPQSQVAALSNPENKDCLIRLYLGADAGYKFTGDGPWRTSLRNFELYFDMACALGRLAFPDMDLNIRLLAQEMAVGLAIIHWEAKCDGMAADWVLGSPSRSELLLECAEEFETMQIAEVTPNSKKGGRSTYLWILDFDKARPIEYDKSCIPLLLGGVTANDPYLPNPKNSPKWLYELFEVTYLQASEEILGRKLYKATDRERADIMELPYFFMEAWEEWAQYSEDLGVNLERWSLVDGEVEVEEAEEIEGDDTGEDGDNEMEDGDERASVRWETPFC